MRILITGATGFIGTALLKLLINMAAPYEVLCCVRDINKARLKFGNHANIRYCQAEDYEYITDFNPEIAVHLAAFNTSKDGKEEARELISSNIEYGVMILDALSKCIDFKLFINTGSFSQYYNSGDAYLYSASKSAFEVFLRYYSRRYDWKYVNVVPYTVYGGEKTVKRLIDYIIESLDSPTAISMSPGEQRLDFIHVEDVASFYLAAINNHREIVGGQTFHIGTGINTSIKEVACMIEDISSRKCNIVWGGLNYRDNDIMLANAPSQDFRDCIWTPKYDLRSGLAKYFE